MCEMREKFEGRRLGVPTLRGMWGNLSPLPSKRRGREKCPPPGGDREPEGDMSRSSVGRKCPFWFSKQVASAFTSSLSSVSK